MTGDILGILGFGLAVLLALLKGWETFFRKSRFEADLEWATSGEGPVLEISIANVGWKKDSVRRVLVQAPFPKSSPEETRELLMMQLQGPQWDELPLVLDVDMVTPRLEIPMSLLERLGWKVLQNAIIGGRASLIIENARRQQTTVPIPAPRQGPPTPTPEELSRPD